MQTQQSSEVNKHHHLDEKLIKRGLFARILHAVIFEIIAIILTAVFLFYIEGKNLISMGLLAVVISIIATLWNGIFNFLFDQLQKKYAFTRSKIVRISHAVGFEGGLVIFTIPFIAIYLQINLWHAFVLDISLLLCFLPYSIIYNYIYDKIYLYITKD